MDQRTITFYLARKGLSAVDIRVDLVAALGPESVGHLSVTHYLRQGQFVISKPMSFSEPEPELDDSDDAI
jgi:hypothetical protein